MQSSITMFSILVCGAALAQTQAEVDAAKNAYLQADKSMNTVYKQALSALEGDAEARLVDAHEVWSTYRGAIAEAQSHIYSEGNTRTLVYYDAMREVTEAHSARLKALVDETASPAAEAAPAEPAEPMPADPQANLTTVLGSQRIVDLTKEMNNRLANLSHVRTYLETVVPPAADVDDVLASQGLDPEYVTWLKNNPDKGRQVVMLAVGQELDRRASGNEDDWSQRNVGAVTEVVKRGGFKGALGQIGQELILGSQPPYQFYQYLHGSKGLATEVDRLIDSALAGEV